MELHSPGIEVFAFSLVLTEVAAVDTGHVHGHRAVEVDWQDRQLPGVHHLFQEKEQQLGARDGEGRDEDRAPAAYGLQEGRP